MKSGFSKGAITRLCDDGIDAGDNVDKSHAQLFGREDILALMGRYVPGKDPANAGAMRPGC